MGAPMRKLPLSIMILTLGLGVAVLALPPAPATVRAQAPRTDALTIVANPGLKVRDIPFRTLRRVFSGETTELGGQRLIPFNHPPKDDARRRFDLVVLKLSPEMIGPYWVDRRLRGQNGPPRTVPEPGLLVAVVSKIQGGIGYVPASVGTTAVGVLTVDGKAATDPDYPLR